MTDSFNFPPEPKHPPCDHRGELLKVLGCGCSANKQWQSRACSQVEGGVCVPNIERMNSSAVAKNGNLPHCIDCPLRTVNGAVVGVPTRDEIRKLRNLPVKAMTDARAKRIGINPVEQVVSDVFPRDRMLSDFAICRNQLHHDDAEFNPSISLFNGQHWLVYRQNWTSSNIILAKANPSWEPEKGVESCQFVNIPIVSENSSGREDPRLFTFRGQQWLSYTGFSKLASNKTNVCIGRLTHDGAMDCHFPLHYPDRAKLEKNWVFFEHNDRLYASYLCSPHVVLEVDHFNCRLAYTTQWKSHYTAGHIRGGASPVLHNGEFYHFFHAVQSAAGNKVYSCGVLTFEAKPPFRVTRCSKRPLIAPVPADCEVGGPACAVFPGGAVIDKGRWHVAYGYLDKECRIASFKAEDIEGELFPV